jgi:hypothetical protein
LSNSAPSAFWPAAFASTERDKPAFGGTALPRNSTKLSWVARELARTNLDQVTIVLPVDADRAADVIGFAVEYWSESKGKLAELHLDPSLADELGLGEGEAFPRGDRPIVRRRAGMAGQARFIPAGSLIGEDEAPRQRWRAAYTPPLSPRIQRRRRY